MPKFPFTNYHELNLDWILKKVDALFDASEENAQTIRTYNTRLTAAEQTATSAGTAATAAQQLADAASANANSALSVAGTANTKADSALTAATNAADAVAGALTTAQEAQQTAASAVATATDAAATASSLESLANTANQNATAALETAQTADQKAVTAQTAAATADQKAVAAQTAATTNAGNITTLQTDVSNLNRQISDLDDALDNKADLIIASASGSIASFTDGANDMPIKSLVVNIEPTQAGSGDPSPTNIRPISGHNGAEVTRTGKNMLPSMSRDETINGVTWHVNQDNSISVSGTATGNSVVDFGRGHITLKPGTYTTNRAKDGVVCAIWENSSPAQLIDGSGGTFVLTQNTPIFIRFYVPSGTTVNTTIYPQLELGSTVTDYEPYAGNQISITFPTSAGTVYGGTLDIISGVLTVNRTSKVLDGVATVSDFRSFAGAVGYNDTSTQFPDADYSKPILCNQLVTIGPGISQYYGACKYSGTSFYFWFQNEAFTSEADAKAKVAAANIQCVYYVLHPATYQLTPQQINTLLGSNNIYSDVGSIADVQYPADTKLYIDGKIAELQALVLEN